MIIKIIKNIKSYIIGFFHRLLIILFHIIRSIVLLVTVIFSIMLYMPIFLITNKNIFDITDKLENKLNDIEYFIGG